MLKLLAFLLLVSVAFFLLGCPPLPGSRLYKPISDWESDAFAKADRNVFPNDVRDDFAAHDSDRVAWPGIILGSKLVRTDSTLAVSFLIEHHYYDWIEDFSIQHERIFLSPRGEGRFEATWRLKPDADTTLVGKSTGDMAIVYGIPTAIADSTIAVRAYYVRVIGSEWFATDIMDYGRPGEEVKVLRVP